MFQLIPGIQFNRRSSNFYGYALSVEDKIGICRHLDFRRFFEGTQRVTFRRPASCYLPIVNHAA